MRAEEKNSMGCVATGQELKAIHERSAREHMTSVQEMPRQKFLLPVGDSASYPASGCLTTGSI